jgi:ABC-type multidrug transport system fused ATPase/permease subunit
MKLSFRQSFQLLKRYLKPEWLRVALLFLLLVSGIGLQLLQPQILRDFIDLATGSISQTAVFNLQSLSGTAVLFMLVALFNQLLTGAATYVTQDVRWRVTNELRADLAQHCLSLDMSFHNARTAGEMISRVDEDIKA